jgi:hypothetical protein
MEKVPPEAMSAALITFQVEGWPSVGDCALSLKPMEASRALYVPVPIVLVERESVHDCSPGPNVADALKPKLLLLYVRVPCVIVFRVYAKETTTWPPEKVDASVFAFLKHTLMSPRTAGARRSTTQASRRRPMDLLTGPDITGEVWHVARGTSRRVHGTLKSAGRPARKDIELCRVCLL